MTLQALITSEMDNNETCPYNDDGTVVLSVIIHNNKYLDFMFTLGFNVGEKEAVGVVITPDVVLKSLVDPYRNVIYFPNVPYED